MTEATDSRIIDDSNILKVNDKDVVAFEAVDQCHDFFLLGIQAVCNFELILMDTGLYGFCVGCKANLNPLKYIASNFKLGKLNANTNI